jgi:hypothetical protein
VTALLAGPLAALLGAALARRLQPGWCLGEVLGAGCVVGPPLLTILLQLASMAGLPYAAAVPWLLLGAGALSVVMLLGGAARGRGAPGTRFIPFALAAGVLILEAAHLARQGAPSGDGLTIYGVRARALLEIGRAWPYLQDPMLFAVHPDYPLHQTLWMLIGTRLGAGLPAAQLLPALLVLPGLALFVAARLLRTAGPWPAVLAVLALLAPLRPWVVARAGYADGQLAALLAVAALGLDPRRAEGRWIPAIALGLLPWVKHEGLVLGCTLGALALLLRGFSRPGGLRASTAAIALAGIWPFELARNGMLFAFVEQAERPPLGARVEAAVTHFGGVLLGWDEALGPILIAGLVAAAAVLARCTPGSRLLAAWLPLALLLLPALAVLRGSTSYVNDLAGRLLGQLGPVACALAAEAALGPRGSGRVASRPERGGAS